MTNSELPRRLAACLAPVTAPRDLWDRIEPALSPAAPPSRRRESRLAISAIAGFVALSAAALLAAVVLLPPSAAALAWTFHREPRLELRSTDPAAINAWLAEAGLSPSLRPGAGVQLCGAAKLNRAGSGEPLAAVRFEADGQPATLVVHRYAGPERATPSAEPGVSGTLYRWTRDGREYLLITSTAAACTLCHAQVS